MTATPPPRRSLAKGPVRAVGFGLTGGLAGTLAESLACRIEDRRRGGPAHFDPGVMAVRLSRTWLHRRLPEPRRRWIGRGMRWTYGPSWGLLLWLLIGDRDLGRSWPVAGLALGLGVLGFELVSLPLVRATPPLPAWGRNQLSEEVLNTLLFGLVTALTLQAVRRWEGAR